MDWKECIRQRIVKNVSEDEDRSRSIRQVAKLKIDSADFLPDSHHLTKITLLYDALRELLECIALERGYRVYNHECYKAFPKEVLRKSMESDRFDELRKIRNSINGKQFQREEAEHIIKELRYMISIFS